MATVPYPPWFFEQTSRDTAIGAGYSAKPIAVPPVPLLREAVKQSKSVAQRSGSALKSRRAWDLAIAPVKSLPTTLVFAWFSGTSLQTVTISMTMYMFFVSPFQKILQINEQFKLLETDENRSTVQLARLVCFAANLLIVAVGVYRVGQMGLLPTSESDWLEWQPATKLWKV